MSKYCMFVPSPSLFCVVATKHKNFPKKPLNNKENILSLRYLSRPTFVPLVVRVVARVFACKMQDAIALRFKQLSRKAKKNERNSFNNCSGCWGMNRQREQKKSLLLLCTLCEVKVFFCCLLFYENRFFINFESHSEYKKILNKQCCLFSFLTVSKKLRFVVLVFAIWDAIADKTEGI